MTPSLLPSLVAFVAVIAMIPVALWVMKRAQSLRPGATGPLAIVAGLSVGPRDRIAVVRAADRYLVVGITPAQMTLLATLDQWPGADAGAHPLEAAAATGAPLSSFARLLRQTRHDDAAPPSA